MKLTRRFLVAGTALVMLLFTADGSAQVVEAHVVIEGMSCPFCAFGVEKKLGEVEGVDEIGVEMKVGRADLTAGEGLSIDVAAVPGAVRKAGFTAGEIEIVARGALVREGDGIALRLPGSHGGLILRTVSGHEAGEAQRLANGTTAVEVTGVWSASDDGGETIEVVKIRGISE